MAIAPAAPTRATPPTAQPAAASSDAVTAGIFDFTFHDLVSVINPLQHFPIVSTLYRAITGDTIKPIERVAGDTLYGGWIGLVSSVANLIFEREAGKDLGDTVLAFLEGAKDDHSRAQAANTRTPAAAPSTTGVSSDGNTGLSPLASSRAGWSTPR